jgi:hypothetical protein
MRISHTLGNLGVPVTGTHTDQTIGVTGDTDGANAARKAAAMHAKLASDCDKSIGRDEAKAERKVHVTGPRRMKIQTYRAA